MPAWIDTHCHLDAEEFSADRYAVRTNAAIKGVAMCVIPAVERANFDTVRHLALAQNDAYALGIHPLYTPQAQLADLAVLDAQLTQYRDDPRLVAVGEIGLDFFVPGLNTLKQTEFYRAQLRLARKHGLPVVLHVRKSADALLKGLRDFAGRGCAAPWSGIAHAFNGSDVQAKAFIDMGFALGFGGAVTYERATRLHHLAKTLPLSALVLETDSPDIPPHWLYQTAEARQAGQPQGRNTPAELPRIAQVIADLRGMPVDDLRDACWHNAHRVLPKLANACESKRSSELVCRTAIPLTRLPP